MNPDRPSYRPSQVPPSDSDVPPSAGRYEQEFLYHLYRGSELLQDNAVDEAKAELERALKLQPKDVEGQGLLGVVYFRLGMYPRAIQIYERLRRAVPSEITPLINLALCYLKTGQTELARERLEEVVERAPEHKRAWGYLGLVFQRFGDFEKARIAFERAERPRLAERMAALVQGAADAQAQEILELGAHGASQPPAHSFRPSLMPLLPRGNAGAPSARSLAGSVPPTAAGATGREGSETEPPPSLPVPSRRWFRDCELVFPEEPRLVLHDTGSVLVRIETELAVHPGWLSALSQDHGPFATQTLRRRSAGKSRAVALGSREAPLVSLQGRGRAILSPRPGTQLVVFEVDAEPLFVLESQLVAFEPQVDYQTAPADPLREDAPIAVELSGAGAVVVFSRGPTHSVEVRAERPLLVRESHVIAWRGELAPRVVPAVEAPAGLGSLLGFSGTGQVLLDLSADASPHR